MGKRNCLLNQQVDRFAVTNRATPYEHLKYTQWAELKSIPKTTWPEEKRRAAESHRTGG